MVEIRYKTHCEVADLAGKTLAEAREQLKEDFNIPDNAKARLNGRGVKRSSESQTCLNDGDRISFADGGVRGFFLIAAGLVAFSLCGGWFAFGYTTSSTSINLNVPGGGVDFVDVTVNNTNPLSWNLSASLLGSTGNGTLFDINTSSSNYTGDLIATIYYTNGFDLIDVYRYLNMYITVYDSANNVVDINADGSANITTDRTLLTLKNGSVDLYIAQTTADIYTVKVLDGYFLTHSSWTSGHESPNLYCELSTK